MLCWAFHHSFGWEFKLLTYLLTQTAEPVILMLSWYATGLVWILLHGVYQSEPVFFPFLNFRLKKCFFNKVSRNVSEFIFDRVNNRCWKIYHQDTHVDVVSNSLFLQSQLRFFRSLCDLRFSLVLLGKISSYSLVYMKIVHPNWWRSEQSRIIFWFCFGHLNRMFW